MKDSTLSLKSDSKPLPKPGRWSSCRVSTRVSLLLMLFAEQTSGAPQVMEIFRRE